MPPGSAAGHCLHPLHGLTLRKVFKFSFVLLLTINIPVWYYIDDEEIRNYN